MVVTQRCNIGLSKCGKSQSESQFKEFIGRLANANAVWLLSDSTSEGAPRESLLKASSTPTTLI